MKKRLFILIPLALVAIPIGIEVCYIHQFAVNVPFWDDWALVPLLKELSGGSSDRLLNALWAQHNEHRILFPRLFFLALASISDWNVVWQMYFSLFLSFISLLGLGVIYRKTVRGSLWGFVPISWLVFSLGQWENILWGWQVMIYLQVLGVILGLYLLSVDSLWSTLGAVLCGVVASFSFSTGLLIWPVGVMFLMALGAEKKRAALWILAGILTVVAYYVGYQAPGHHPPLTAGLYSPLTTLRFFLVNVGAPLGGGDANLSMVMGVCLLVLTTIYVLSRMQIKPRLRIDLSHSEIMIGSLVVTSLLSSVAVAIARVGFGYLDWALNSRYTTMTSLAAIGLYMLLLKDTWRGGERQAGGLNSVRYWLFPALLPILFVGLAMANLHGVSMGQQVHAARVEMRQALHTFETQPDDALMPLFFPDIVRERASFLKDHHLSVFTDAKDLETAPDRDTLEQPVPD